jgi:hypothetical protein
MADKILKTLNVKKYLPNLKSVAPPGREDQVKALKKKVGVPGAYKIAWSQENKS